MSKVSGSDKKFVAPNDVSYQPIPPTQDKVSGGCDNVPPRLLNGELINTRANSKGPT
jgi:hypothetical protein